MKAQTKIIVIEKLKKEMLENAGKFDVRFFTRDLRRLVFVLEKNLKLDSHEKEILEKFMIIKKIK